MCAAFTTAAVINHSLNAPEKWVSPLDYMPNHRYVDEPKPKISVEEAHAMKENYMAKVMQLAAELKQGGGPMHDLMGISKTDDAN